MAYNNGIDGKALLDEISKVIDAAANQYREAGEDAGEEYIKGVVDGIKKHSKEAKSEISKMYEDFNKATNNFKSRKSVTNEDWSKVLGLSKELLKSERYADNVREKLSGISATFKNIGKVSGLDKIVAELDKAENKLETVTWSEAGKNYKKRTTTARKPNADKPKVQANPEPVIKAEEKKQEATVDTTKKINEQTEALRKQASAAESAANAQEKYNKRMSEIKDKYSGDIGKKKQLISNQEAWIKYLNGSLDESKFKTGGKKEATDQLRSLTNYMVNGRSNNYANDPGEYPKEMAEVAWMRGYQEAERQGVADSVLRRFDTDARYNFDSNLKTLQEEHDYRKKVMDDAYAELNSLYLERDKEAFTAFTDNLMPDGPQSDEESRIVSEITEQVANKTLDYTDAKANLEKSITTLRNMASSEAKVNLQNLVNDLKKTYDTETFDKVFGADLNMFSGFDKIDDAGVKELYDMLIESNQKYQASLVKTVDTQRELNSEQSKSAKIQESNILYHAGDLSNPSKTLKSFPLGNVPPTRSNGIGGLTGLYTTEDLEGFIGNEWQGAPISTIDPSGYKLLSARTNEIADSIGGFLNDVNATIYGYYNAIDEKDWSLKQHTDVKTVDELYTAHCELFKESALSYEQFAKFVNDSKEKVAGKSFADISLPAIDEGVAKSGISSAMQGVTAELFQSDSFQTQLVKMLGYEGVDLRGTKYNGTYSGGSVIFDVKPESVKTTNEKWSDVMSRNGYEVTEDDLKHEEKRRQLAFETAKAYSKQADVPEEVESSQKPSAQDRLASVDAELEAKKRQFKEVATEGRAVTEELYDKAHKYNVPETAIPAVHFSTDDLLKAYEERDGKAFDYKEQIKNHKQFVDTNDVAKAFYQMSMFPEKYGGNPLDYFESKKYFGDERISSESLIPLGNGKSITFGSSSGWLMRTNHKNSVVSGVDENGVVIDKENFPLPDQSFDKISKETKRILGMSYDEVAKLPIIRQAAMDYEAQYKQDNAMWKALHMLGDKTPEFVDETKPLTDKYSDLGKRAEAIKADISRLKQEKKALEQEINIEAQSSQEEVKEVPKKAPAQTKAEKHEPTVFEDENGQLALFDDVSSSAQRAIEDVKELENKLKNIENLEGQISIDDYAADKAKLEAESTQAAQFETDSGQLAFLQGMSDAAQKAESDIEEVTDAARKLNDIPGQLDLLDESYLNQSALNGQKNVLETPNDELKETFDIIQQGDSITGRFVTTAKTAYEALENMRNALPDDKKAWSSYIDGLLNSEDNYLIDSVQSISRSMGRRSEQYKLENLGDGRVAITFSGIREEIEKTVDAATDGKKSLQDVLELINKMSGESGDSDAFNKRNKALIDKANDLTSGADYDQLYSQLIENENKYQQELEETNRINKEREGQLEAYTQAAGAFLGDSKYDSVAFDDKNKLFENFGNKIMQDGLSASDAMDQLYLSMEKLIQQSKEMPDDIIEGFGAEKKHVAETVSSLQKLSSIDLTRIFGSVDLKKFLTDLNIDELNHQAFRTLFEELMQITNAMANGIDVGNAFNLKMDEITNTIMQLGGNMLDLGDDAYAEEMKQFLEHMNKIRVQFNDTIKADYTKDQWKALHNRYKSTYLTSDLTKGIPADSLYHELNGLYPDLFPEGVLSQQDQFKLIFEKLDEARRLQTNNWKTLYGFTSDDRDGIQSSVDDIYNQMSSSLFADTSAQKLNTEADAFKEVEQSATKAANAKGKFSKKNKELGDGAAESSDDLDDEAESLENVNRAAANLPDVSAYDSTTVRYDANGNPYNVSGTSRQEMIDGTHVRSTDNYQFDAENNRWDYMGTVQSSERTREMVQALEEYYRILNQIQKLRLDPSNAIHTEEINKLETEDLARAYQRVCDLGIQVNDIEGQINLSVSQRRALLDVELRARQEMYDVIAKMEDKQATAATKPFQKTVADEIKKAANIDTNVRLLGDDGASDRLQSQIADYRRLVDELVEMRLQLARNSDLTNDVDFSNRFADTAKRAQNARVAIEGVFKESQKLQKLGTLIATDSSDVSRLENLKGAMIEFANSALDGEVKINGFNKEGTEMYVTLNQGADAVQNITVALDRATGHLQAFSTGTSKATNEWEDFKTKAVDGAKNIIGMYVGFQEGVQAIRTGVNYVKEIDLAMTELKKVTDETDASYKQFLQDASGTASIIGSTISDFTEATATFARLGYSLEEASSMAETAVVYRNVADGLDSVEESSDSIISTMMAFGIEANDTMSIIDRFNAVGNSFAITSAGIGDALQRSASALYSAGNTIDESIALVTAANSVIQNPEQVGNALKTLSLRIRGVKTELEEAGLETEGMAENTAKLQEKLLALTHGKVDIMLDADTFKSTTQILREMSTAWEDMNDIERASALELIGGKRQANILSSVIQNFETVEDVIETSMNSSGSAIAENEKWLDSIEGKTYQFTNALQTMWSNMLDSEVIKGFLDFGTDAIQFLDTGAGKVIALVAAMKLMAKFKGFSLGGIVQGIGDTINKITTAQNALQILSKTTKIGQGYDFSNVNAYAQAVANLTAKQQANLLASQGLNKEQIRYALTLNQVDDAAMREAMAHVHATTAKQQENAVTAQSIQQKAQELAMSYRTQAATADETRAKELNVVADILENATSEEAIENNLQEAITSKGVSASLVAETTSTLGLTTAKTGLLAVTKALMAANPIGFWITVGSTILSLIPIVSDLVDAFTKSAEEIKQEANEISKAYSDAVDEINNNLKSLGITSDSSSITTLEKEFATLAAGVDRYGNNISLTSDEYERYREICEQIVGINPRIASGYDSATEAIGNNAGVLSQLIDLQKEQARFAAQEYVNDENLEILSKDAVNDYKEAIKDSGNDILESKNELFGILNQGSNQSTINHILQTLGYSSGEIAKTMSKYYNSELNEYDSYLFINDFIDEIAANSSKFGKYTGELNNFFAEYENTIKSGEQSVEAAQDGLLDKLLIVPKSDEAYDQLSSESKNFLSEWIKHSGLFKLDESTTAENVQDMRDTILDMMDILVSDTKNIEYKGQKFTAQDILGQIYDLDSSYVSFGTYKEQLKDLLESFWNSLSNAQKEEYGFDDFEDFQISLGFDFVADEEAESDMVKGYARAKKISEEEAKAYFDSLPAVEVKRLLQVDWDTVDASNVDETIQNSKKAIQDANTILSELANTLDGIQSKYDTLQGAIDEFNERGAISGETLKSLIDNNLLQYLTFTENGLIADANAMKMLEQAAINEAYAMLNAAMVQDMENYALGKTEQLSALAQNAIGLAGSAAANAGAQAAQGAQGFLTFASAVAQAGIIDPGNLTAGLQQIYNAYQNIGNAIGHASAYRPSDAYKSASGGGGGKGGGSSSNSAKEIDWIEHYYTEIENRIDELNARLENKISNVQALDAKNTIIDQIIDLYDQKQQKLANAVATYDARADYLFSTFSSDIQNKINNGSLDISSIKDESLASNIDEYYDYIEAASQARVEAEELKQTIADLAKQKFDNISTAYENEIGLVDAYIDALQDQIDATEARGEQVGASYYEGMIDSAEKRKQSLEEERNALQASLDEAVKLGQVEVGSDTWYEMVNAIYEVDSAIVEAETSMEEWQTAINDLHWENFDKLIDKLENISDELDNVYERLTDNNEAFDENGDWTNQGIAALGILTQKMEQAQFAAQQYADQIDQLNSDYADGKYSEEEYNEKLAELTEGQWESIEAYEAAKDEIVDLNKARVDAVKDGMQKELDAYKELIDAKKESLEADKDAHKWANTIAEKEKNISDIQRKLAALASDNSTSAIAQKKKLQAELLKAQSELDEAYYDKSIEDQQDALDKEYESYEENQQKEIDSLEEWLDDREKILQDSFDLVKENTQVVYDELLKLSKEYGIEISDEILAPWLAGKDAIGEYKDAFLNTELNEATSAFISQLESVKDEWEEVASAAEEAADRQIAAVRRQQQETVAAYKEMQDSLSTITIGSMGNVGHDDSGNGGGGAGWGGGGLAGGTATEEEVKPYSILEIFTNSLGKSYNKFLNDTAADFDYKMSEAFLQNADQYNQEFKERVPEEYKQFLQLVCDGLNISSTEGVGIADSLSKVFALEDIPYHYKVFLANVVEGLALAEEQGLEASGALSAIFASEDVPQNYKDFLDCIIGNLNNSITNGEQITDSTSAEFASNAIPLEYQNYLDSIMQGLQAPVLEGTQDANNTSANFFGSGLPEIINGVFADVETAAATDATWASREMVRSTNNLWDNLVAWWNGVMNSLFGGGSSTHTSSGGRSHGGGGGGFADGTANANGTAYAGGNWGAPKTETSLVGELGPEILVRNGKWTTVGENGAEFTQVKKGDIIFNHKQAEQLLKHGHVTGRGKAYASGTWKNASDHLDDLGEELTMCIGPNGGLQFLSKGAANMATDTIGNLTNLTQLDPTDILNRSRPSIGVSPSVVNNTMEFKIDASVGELIHVDHLDGNNLDEIGKFVDKAWEKKMQTLNNSIKKFTR